MYLYFFSNPTNHIFVGFIFLYINMYFLKIKGVNKMPDFIQVRDDDFTLVNYFKASNLGDIIRFSNSNIKIEKIKEIIPKLEYGKIVKID